MNIGIVGMGLIGGSLAKAFKAYTDYKIFAYDKDEKIMKEVINTNIAEPMLTDCDINKCRLIILAIPPDSCVEFVKMKCSQFNKSSLVIDCSGVKESISRQIEPVAEKYGFDFIGCHPMAGYHLTGFSHSDAKLFKNASFIICPGKNTKESNVSFLKDTVLKLGFSNVQISTPTEHDKIIAYTSQLCHIVSNAYVKNSIANNHFGYSAGSYNDLTRVAKLDEVLWTELFMNNRDNLIDELDEYIGNLIKYKKALETSDRQLLKDLLKEGRIRKESIDGVEYRN